MPNRMGVILHKIPLGLRKLRAFKGTGTAVVKSRARLFGVTSRAISAGIPDGELETRDITLWKLAIC